MASTYVNDLRLNEMATGDGSGTWGTTTNTNLELIGEALGYGTEGITTNADTHTSTVADGATDPVRAMFVKYTGTLDSACTITIAPNTVNRMQFIENGTSGSQNIIISQGSGANITIPPGDVKAVYLDGAGSGAAVVDAFASLNVVDLKVEDDLTVTDDLIVNGDIDLEGSIDVNGTSNLDVVDIDGAVNMATTALVTGVLTTTATQVATGGITSGSDIISDTDSTDSLGSTGVRWLKGWFDTLAAGTLTIGSGSVTDSSGAISFGNENLTTTGVGTFASLDISGDIDVDGTTNLDVVDIDGAVDMASTLAVAGVVTANAGVVVDNITIDGTTIALSSGDLLLDVAGDIVLDADGTDITFKDGGTTFGKIGQLNNDLYIGTNNTTLSFIDGQRSINPTGTNGAQASDLISLGDANNRFKNLFLSGNLDVDGTANLDIVDIDGAVDMATTLLVTGEATLASHLNMGDGDVIKLGTGADLQIYHDGNNALFTNTTGNLYIQDSNGTVHIQGKSGEESITAAADGAVTLYHNNSAKLATTATGTDTTGIAVSDGMSTNTSGTSNFIAGVNAGNTIASGGNYNVCVGDEAGTAIDTGDNNVVVGYAAHDNLTTGSLNTAIGYNLAPSAVDVDSEIVIGSSITGAGTNTVRIGTGGGTATLGLDGSDTSWAAASDSRLKKDVTDSTAGLEFINDLRPITFKWNAKNEVAEDLPQHDADSSDPIFGEGKAHHGFIAQEVKSVIDDHSDVLDGNNIWHEDPDGTQQLSQGNLVPMLVKAVQELSAKITELEAKPRCKCNGE